MKKLLALLITSMFLVSPVLAASGEGNPGGGGYSNWWDMLFSIFFQNQKVCATVPDADGNCVEEDHFDYGETFYVYTKMYDVYHDCKMDVTQTAYVGTEKIAEWRITDSGCYEWYWSYWWLYVNVPGWQNMRITADDNIDGSHTNYDFSVYISCTADSQCGPNNECRSDGICVSPPPTTTVPTTTPTTSVSPTSITTTTALTTTTTIPGSPGEGDILPIVLVLGIVGVVGYMVIRR
jgi:hypothetical protein